MRLILFALLVVVLVLAFYMARALLLAALLAVVFANLLCRMSRWTCERTPLTYKWAVGLFLLIGFGIITGICFISLSAVAGQFDQLTQSFDQAVERTNEWLKSYEWGKYVLQQKDGAGVGSKLWSWSTDVALAFFTSLGPIAVFLAVMVYGAMDPTRYRKGLLWLIPKAHEDKADALLREMSTALVWWTAGRMASMTIVGVMTWLCLWILGIPGPLALGLIAGLFSFVPNLGPLLSVLPALAAASTLGPWPVLWVALTYIGIQAVESNLITPLIQQRAVSVPPALLIVFQLIMGAFAGIWGMITATPILVLLMIVVQELYVRDTLGKNGPAVTDH